MNQPEIPKVTLHNGLPLLSLEEAIELKRVSTERRVSIDFNGYIYEGAGSSDPVYFDWHVRFGCGASDITLLKVSATVSDDPKYSLNPEKKRPQNQSEVTAYVFQISDLDPPDQFSGPFSQGAIAKTFVDATQKDIIALLDFTMALPSQMEFDEKMEAVEQQAIIRGIRVIDSD